MGSPDGLRADLLELDVAAMDHIDQEAAPHRAKGSATLAGWLVVQFGTVDGLREVLKVVRAWRRARTGR